MWYLQLYGLYAWILIGLVAGLLAPRVLGGAGRLTKALLGVAGAVLGGLLATALGFGGLAGFDLRGFTTATLCAIVTLLLWRLREVPGR
ncbi:MAG: GlsB/YeaQ/YmgE family stress response membrane protein [Acidobacteria bacterium]|nr:MAG: GlsB/YeaQ/YmgE family stress response membrane protein [Acidobacteriota bacterium]